MTSSPSTTSNSSNSDPARGARVGAKISLGFLLACAGTLPALGFSVRGDTTLLGDFSTANYENPEVFIIGSCEELSLVAPNPLLGVANDPHDTSYTFTVDAESGQRGDITIASNILASTYTETTAVKMFSDYSGNVCYLAQYASGTIEATGTVTLTSTVPEPSAFGLLAGAFALALCAVSRRRRRKS